MRDPADHFGYEKLVCCPQVVETILKLYSLMGLLIAIFGIAYFVLTTLDIELNKTQQIALTISGIGIALSVTSLALLVMRRNRVGEDVKKLQLMQDWLNLFGSGQNLKQRAKNFF